MRDWACEKRNIVAAKDNGATDSALICVEREGYLNE